MRLALLTSVVAVWVEDEETAASLAIEAAKQGDLTIAHLLETYDATSADIEADMAPLGVSVTMLPETIAEHV